MKVRKIKKAIVSRVILYGGIVTVLALIYLAWTPGKVVKNGRHDRRTNAIWLQHGWLGDDLWFARNQRDKVRFRETVKTAALSDLLTDHGVKYVFPHLCPCDTYGRIPPVDFKQTELFLDHFEAFEVVPWIGGVLGVQCFPDDESWRARFVESVDDLFKIHPRLAGVQVNIEPLPSGNTSFLLLLDELRASLPAGKILSVAAYPPPTRWHPYPEVHWDEFYYREVAKRSDQLAPMMYDTALKWEKPYRKLVADWTVEVLDWSEGTQVLLGVPVYDDANTDYHDPDIENLQNALSGIHAGLSRYKQLPEIYQGVAIYCEWEMDDQKWRCFRKNFERGEAAE